MLLIFTGFTSCNRITNKSNITGNEKGSEGADSLVWHWDAEFNSEEKSKLIDWIEQVFKATETTLGDYPFDVHVHFERDDNSKTPVSFGLASRKGGKSSIRLYVDPAYSIEKLLGDWTAPHEFSHLAIPFLGKKHKWFSEGFATYLSRKTLIAMGYLSDAEYESLYLSKIIDTKKYFNSTTKPFVEVADSLLSHHIYSSLYWGSSSYFMLVDRELKSMEKMPFIDVIKEYQTCCRFTDHSILDVIKTFDSIIGAPVCQELMVLYRNEPSSEVMKAF